MLSISCDLHSMSPLMYGKRVTVPKKDDETHEQHEDRTWSNKVHLTEEGQCFIPPFALKNCLESAARWLSLKIPGEGKKTFTKRFTSGVLVTEKLLLTNSDGSPLVLDDIEPIKLFVPSNGQRGGGTRVDRIFPTLHSWHSSCVINVFDNKITEKIFEKHLSAAGKFIGFLSMRVENGGINGRFGLNNLVSESVGMEELLEVG